MKLYNRIISLWLLLALQSGCVSTEFEFVELEATQSAQDRLVEQRTLSALHFEQGLSKSLELDDLYGYKTAWDNEDITPETWRAIKLSMLKDDGSRVDIELLRPLWWLDKSSAKVGANINLELSEVGVSGVAEILSIESCKLDSRKSPLGVKLVTGKFIHENATVLDLHIKGEVKPLGVTRDHLIFSESRDKFIPAGSLRKHEKLRLKSGSRELVGKTMRLGHQTVYNIEVHDNHTYYVTGQSILVHNTYANNKVPDELYHYTDNPNGFNGPIWRHTSFTDNKNLTPAEAVQKLGLKRPPTHVVVVKNNGSFVQNRPFIVQSHPLGSGGGTDYINPSATIPVNDILRIFKL